MASKRGGRQVSGHPGRRALSPGALGNEDRYRESVEQFNARLRRDRLLGLTGLAVSLVVLLLNLVMEGGRPRGARHGAA